MTTSNKPEKTIRIGSTSAAIWKRTRTDGQGHFYTVQIQRSYRVEEGTQYSGNFNHDDLMNLALLAKRAEAWIADQS